MGEGEEEVLHWSTVERVCIMAGSFGWRVEFCFMWLIIILLGEKS
jgi:hypothetical protein